MVRSVKLRVVGCPYGDSRDDRVTAVDGQAPDWAWERRRSGMRGGRWRVKGERDAGTAVGLAKRCWLASAAGSGTASRRRGRRSGPLTRLMGEYPGRQGSAVVAADRGRLPGGGGTFLAGEPPDRRTLPPGEGGGSGAGPRRGAAARRSELRRSSSGARRGHAGGDAQEQRAALGLDAARGLEVGLHGAARVEQGEVHARLEIHASFDGYSTIATASHGLSISPRTRCNAGPENTSRPPWESDPADHVLTVERVRFGPAEIRLAVRRPRTPPFP